MHVRRDVLESTMSLPYHRGNMAQQRGSASWGTRDQRAEETSRTLMEQENDERWRELGEQVSLLKSVGNMFADLRLIPQPYHFSKA